MKCTHCTSALIEHQGKDGALHCNICGCCFLADGETLRPGHPQCAGAPTRDDLQSYSSASDIFVNPDMTDIPLEVTKGGSEGVADAAEPEDTPTPERRTRRKA